MARRRKPCKLIFVGLLTRERDDDTAYDLLLRGGKYEMCGHDADVIFILVEFNFIRFFSLSIGHRLLRDHQRRTNANI